MKTKELAFSSISQTFQKAKGQLISQRELIFYGRTHIYICFVEVFLGNYRVPVDHKCESLFYVRDLEKSSVERRNCITICSEISRGTKASGETNMLRILRYWFATGFSVNETLSFHEKCQIQSYLLNLGNQTLRLKR